MPYYNTNQTAIFYTDTGRGRPILFIHGLGASSAMFEPQVAAFRTGYRVLCPDLRGSGQSGRLTGPIATLLRSEAPTYEHQSLMPHSYAVFCSKYNTLKK